MSFGALDGAAWNKHDTSCLNDALRLAVGHELPSLHAEYGGLRLRFDFVLHGQAKLSTFCHGADSHGDGHSDVEMQDGQPATAGQHSVAKVLVGTLKTSTHDHIKDTLSRAADGSTATSSTVLIACKAAAKQIASKKASRQQPNPSPSPAKAPMERLWPGEGKVSAVSGGRAQRGSTNGGCAHDEPALVSKDA